jgi:HEAT repeat protein
MDDSNVLVRQRAAASLAEFGSAAAAAVPALVRTLRDRSGDVSASAAYALGRIAPDPPTVLPALIDALRDGDAAAPDYVVSAIRQLHAEPAAVPLLGEMLRDADVLVRRQAAAALGRIGPRAEAAVPQLVAALRDEQDYIRRQAAFALGQIGPPARSAVAALATSLGDRDDGVRLEAIGSLALIGPDAKSAVPDLLQWANNSALRQDVLAALRRIDPDAIPTLG